MKKGAIGLAAVAIVLMTSLAVYVGIIALGHYAVDEKKLVFHSASRIVDRNGNELMKLYAENREIVPISRIPRHVREAFIAVEDSRFYRHHGVDVPALLRALYRDVAAGGKVEGGSTITQQLVKNVFLTNEKTWFRKTKELVIALNLERTYTKDQLLEYYLNQIYFGHGAYGIAAASQLYFQKQPEDLTVEEGALLAALPKSPSAYSPVWHPEESRNRRNLVLSLMQQQGYLSAEDTVRSQGRTLSLHMKKQEQEDQYASYMDMVFREAEERYGLSHEEMLRGGYTFTIAMDKKLQAEAYEAFRSPENFPDEKTEGAFVLLDSETGGIRAAVGGRNYQERGWNRVYARRQPGSVLKPLLVYAPALETGRFKPYSLLPNEKLSFGGYAPRNYDNRYTKEITMYDAVKDSVNVPAVWLLNEIGISTAKGYLEKAGAALPDKGLSMALGGLKEGMSPLELAKLYRSFASSGSLVEPYVIERIQNRQGEVIAEPDRRETVLFSRQTAWYMTRMLEGAVKDGTGQAGRYDGALAGKTGTTSLPGNDRGVRDAWFVGYTPSLVGAVWMGYDKTGEQYMTGGSGYPTRLFKQILRHTDEEAAAAFKQPGGVENVEDPIRVGPVEAIQAKLTFSPFGLFTAKLTWKPLPDERVQYRIYKKEGVKETLAGTVTGKGEYRVKFLNVFARPQFYVVPYNPQTEREGEKTSLVRP
ncbi:transglycosylase domain-containing protein [Ectobacillus ponti]|uniref:transglycosylase domain-containing protein n=1 Tax=Ectobacillus ponti TaxID=2961894 RepID=UPI003F6803C9